MPENEPPLGKPIYDEPQAPDSGTNSEPNQPREGQNVVITPQTAGSAGAAHPQES